MLVGVPILCGCVWVSSSDCLVMVIVQVGLRSVDVVTEFLLVVWSPFQYLVDVTGPALVH